VASDWEKQLAALRALTATTGSVHDAQMFQIRMWGQLAFGYTKWEAEIDVAGKTVIYAVTKKKHPKDLAKFVASLDNSIHWLFGDNWGLRVKEGDKSLYEGKRQKTNVNDERKSRASNREGSELPE
jgi:hypothetical protein